jgi:hypothetical protein
MKSVRWWDRGPDTGLRVIRQSCLGDHISNRSTEMNSESKSTNWNFDPEEITEGMRQYPVIDIEYPREWTNWGGEPRYLWHNWDDSNPIHWEELLVYDLNWDTCPPIPMGRVIKKDFHRIWHYAEIFVTDSEAHIDGWDYNFLAAPGEEPTMSSPEVPVDWSGFLEALFRALANEVDDDEERVEETMSSLLGDGVRVVDLIKALRDQ